MLDWIQDNEALAYWVGSLSLVMLLVFPILIIVIVVRLPADYLAAPRRPRYPRRRRTLWRLLLVTLKNALGGLFVLAGVAMLVLPGQGLLTILLGLSLMNFPGKFRLERWLIARGATLRLINRLRRRYGQPSLVLNHPPQSPSDRSRSLGARSRGGS